MNDAETALLLRSVEMRAKDGKTVRFSGLEMQALERSIRLMRQRASKEGPDR